MQYAYEQQTDLNPLSDCIVTSTLLVTLLVSLGLIELRCLAEGLSIKALNRTDKTACPWRCTHRVRTCTLTAVRKLSRIVWSCRSILLLTPPNTKSPWSVSKISLCFLHIGVESTKYLTFSLFEMNLYYYSNKKWPPVWISAINQ